MVKINTSSKGKLEEYQRLFSKLKIPVEATSQDLKEIDSDPLSVVVHKASQLEEGVLVEDTSLHVEGAEIGVHIKWFLDHLKNYEGKKATWIAFLAYRKGGQVFVFKGEIVGKIVAKRGEEGFSFDPYFLPNGAAKTLAEEKPDRYNARAQAVEAYIKETPFAVSPPIYEWDGPWQ